MFGRTLPGGRASKDGRERRPQPTGFASILLYQVLPVLHLFLPEHSIHMPQASGPGRTILVSARAPEATLQAPGLPAQITILSIHPRGERSSTQPHRSQWEKV